MSIATTGNDNLEKFSPISQKQMRKDLHRKRPYVSQLIYWFISLLILSIEALLWDSPIGSFLLSALISTSIVAIFEKLILLYIVTMIIWLTYKSFDALFSKKSYNQCNQSSVAVSPSNMSNVSHISDAAWVDEHPFGTPYYDNKYAALNKSSHSNNSSFRNANISYEDDDDLCLSLSNSTRASPYNKQIESIHTRQQLDRLLRKEGADATRMDVSLTSLHNKTYFNVLDMGCSGERKPYQISEEVKSSDVKDASGYQCISSGGRVHLSPSNNDSMDDMSRLKHVLQHARNTPKKAGSPLRRSDSGLDRRRRSQSSPDRQIAPSQPIPQIDSATCRLEESDLLRGEHRLRAWIVNTIVAPLNKRIKEVNSVLEKESSATVLRVGSSSVDALRAALSDRPHLRSTSLLFILPYLSSHINQSYVVNRISELAADGFMREYKWNSGGAEVSDEKSITGRVARRPWGEHLITDAQLVFSLFCAYLDSQLTSSAIIGYSCLEQPFTSHYTLRTPHKPTAVHLAPYSFYIHMTSLVPPHFEMVHTDSDGTPSRSTISRGANNLFRCILLFVHHAKQNNSGRIDQLSIGSSGLRISSILD